MVREDRHSICHLGSESLVGVADRVTTLLNEELQLTTSQPVEGWCVDCGLDLVWSSEKHVSSLRKKHLRRDQSQRGSKQGVRVEGFQRVTHQSKERQNQEVENGRAGGVISSCLGILLHLRNYGKSSKVFFF